MKSSKSLALALGVAWLAGCGGGPEDTSLRAAELTSHRLTVAGPDLVDELGRKVLLRGVASGGRAKMPPYAPFDYVDGSFEQSCDDFFARVAGLGGNSVRLVLEWEAIEPTQGTYDAAYLARYRTMLDAAGRNGLGVIVEMHQDVFASPFCGDGFPIWAIGSIPHGAPHYDCSPVGWGIAYFAPTNSVNQSFDRLWSDAGGLQQAFEDVWRYVATELGAHPAVAAFEILNEPSAGSIDHTVFESQTLPAFHARIGGAIQSVAGPIAIFGDGRATDAMGQPNALALPALANFVFAPHFYDSDVVLGMPPSSTLVPTEIRGLLAPARTWNVPVAIGEFGAPQSNPSKASFVRMTLDVLDHERAHALMWDATMTSTLWNGEDFSALDVTGAERDWAGELDRGYPRAVDGTLASFTWDASAHTFAMNVTDAGTEVSEVHLPTRHLGQHPRITVDGARWHWIASQQLLVIRASAGAAYTVMVQ